MKKLTVDDLLNLKYGDKVYKFNGTDMDQFQYVHRMPSSPDRYLIFSAGEKLIHLYIHTDGTYNGEWYSGDYSIEFIDNLEIELLEKKLEKLKKLAGKK
jgi:hypothetical protein